MVQENGRLILQQDQGINIPDEIKHFICSIIYIQVCLSLAFPVGTKNMWNMVLDELPQAGRCESCNVLNVLVYKLMFLSPSYRVTKKKYIFSRPYT